MSVQVLFRRDGGFERGPVSKFNSTNQVAAASSFAADYDGDGSVDIAFGSGWDPPPLSPSIVFGDGRAGFGPSAQRSISITSSFAPRSVTEFLRRVLMRPPSARIFVFDADGDGESGIGFYADVRKRSSGGWSEVRQYRARTECQYQFSRAISMATVAPISFLWILRACRSSRRRIAAIHSHFLPRGLCLDRRHKPRWCARSCAHGF